MDITTGYDPTLPLDVFDGSTNPDLLTEVTFGTHLENPDGSVPMVAKVGSGRMSPIRARTMKEYDQQISVLKKENFSLKLRIYFLEERMQQKFGDGEDVFKTNIKLKVECESLKKELSDKHNLLKQASNAMENMSSNHHAEMMQVRDQTERELMADNHKLQDQLKAASQNLEEAEQLLQHKEEEILDLEEKLKTIDSEMRSLEQKGGDSMKALMAELEEKQKEIQALSSKNAALEKGMGVVESEKQRAQHKLDQLSKQIERRDRDLEDVVDDQVQKIEDLSKELKLSRERIKSQDTVIGQLEDFLKAKDEEKKEAEKALNEAEDQLSKEKSKIFKRNIAIQGMQLAVKEKTKEIEALAKQLEEQGEKSKQLQDEYHQMALHSEKTAQRQHEELELQEQQLTSLKCELSQRELELENLTKSLGKKEGELEGFKDLLNKAQNALQQSEDAVEVLQDQLKKEQTRQLSFDTKPNHYKEMYENSQRILEDKEDIIRKLNESLRDKERQLLKSMELFTDPDKDAKNQLEKMLKERDEIIEKQKKSLSEKDALLQETLKRAPVSTEEYLQLQSMKQEKERALEEAVEERDKMSIANADRMNNLLRKLQGKEAEMKNAVEKYKKDLENKELEIDNLKGEINRLGMELRRKETELQNLDDQTQYSNIQHKDMTDKLKAVLADKDQTIQKLIDEAEKYKNSSSQNTQFPHAQMEELHHLRTQNMLLKDHLKNKEELIERLQSLLSRHDNGLDQEMHKLLIELATKTEALKAAKATEQDLRDQLRDLRERLKSEPKGDKEFHRLEKEVIYLKDQMSGQNNWQQPPPPDRDGQILYETMKAQLEELKKLNSSVNKERQILKNLFDSGNSDPSRVLQEELSALKSLRGELEQGVERNSQMRALLERQMSDSSDTADTTVHDADDLKKCLNYIKLELEASRINNACLQSKLDDLQQRQHVDVSTSPPRHRYSPDKRSPSPSNIPLNRQSLSDMSAPMLRKLIRQLQQQLEQSEKQNAELQRRLYSVRDIPGRNEDDINCIPYLRAELESLKVKLQEKEEEVIEARCRQVPGAEKQVQTADFAAQTDVFDLASPHDVTQKGQSTQKKTSQIPRLKVTHPLSTNVSDITQPHVLKSLLFEAKKRITDLEDKLKATEGTVHHQSQKIKYYRGLLQDHGVNPPSPMWSRSNSESNIPGLVLQMSSQNRAVSHGNLPSQFSRSTQEISAQDNLPSVKSSIDSAVEADFRSCEGLNEGNSYEDLREQVHQLKERLSRQQEENDILRSPGANRKSENGSRHSDSFITRSTFNNLQEQVHKLTQHLQETKDRNSELQRKLLQQQHAQGEITDLREQLEISRETVKSLEARLTELQGSSVHEILTSQKSEIVFLKKKLSDTQNSCVQLDKWLLEVSEFLEGLMLEDQTGGSSSIRGVRNRVDQARDVLQTVSSTEDITPAESMTDEYKTSMAQNKLNAHARLTTELKFKHREVERLTQELSKKNSQIEHLNQELLIFQSRFTQSESPVSSTTSSSAADGNIGTKNSYHKDSPSRHSATLNSTKDTFSPQSQERMRHMTGSSDGSHLGIQRLRLHNIETDDEPADSSQASTGYHSSRLSDNNESLHLHLSNSAHKDFSFSDRSHYTNLLDTDERLLYNRRLTEDHLFDNSPTQLGFTSDHNASRSQNHGSDLRQVDNLRARLHAVEDLNETLKDQLNVYEKLCKSVGVQNSPNKSVQSSDNDSELLRQHLAELRALRLKLEHSLKCNERLQDHLQHGMDGHHNDAISNNETTKFQQQIQLLENSLQQEKSKSLKLEQIIQQKEESLKRQKDQLTCLVVNIKKQGEQVMEKDKTISEQVNQIQQMNQSIQDQKNQLQEKESVFVKKEKQVKALHEKYKQAESSKKEKEEHNQMLLKEVEKLITQNEELNIENTRLVSQNEQLNKNYVDVVSQREHFCQEKEKMIHRNSRLNEELRRADKEITKLHEDLEKVKQTQQEYQDLNKTLGLELSIYEKLQGDKENSLAGSGGLDVREILAEIRQLRINMERLMENNNAVRRKLEELLLHQTSSPRQKEVSPTPSQDAPDGQPSPRADTAAMCQGTRMGDSDNLSVSSDVTSSASLGVSSWPTKITKSQSTGQGSYSQYNNSRLANHSEGNLSYYVDDPPSLLADITNQRVDSDLRSLFVICKLDDFEKLKKEHDESLVVLSGIEARIKDRLNAYRNVSTLESVEYSTMREMSLSAENLRLCLDAENSLLQCFWTSQLPKEDMDTTLMSENNELRSELLGLRTKYSVLSRTVNDTEKRLHDTNQQKKNMEDIIYRQLRKTEKVMVQARENFEKAAQNSGMKSPKK